MYPSSNLYIGKRPYQISLLQQRNAELLAVSRVNMEISGPASGFLKRSVDAVERILQPLALSFEFLSTDLHTGLELENCSAGDS